VGHGVEIDDAEVGPRLREDRPLLAVQLDLAGDRARVELQPGITGDHLEPSREDGGEDMATLLRGAARSCAGTAASFTEHAAYRVSDRALEDNRPEVWKCVAYAARHAAVAAGKVALAAARGEEIPAGWIVDQDGRQTTDPTRLRKGGALLPLGGTEGYKGSGLAAMVEVLCGLLTGLGFGVEPTGRHNDGCFMAVFNVAAFRPLTDFKKEVAEFARYLKATPPSAGSTGVL